MTPADAPAPSGAPKGSPPDPSTVSAELHRTGGPLVRLAHAHGVGWGSVRVRLSLLYSAVVFGLGAVLVSLVYIGLTEALRKQPVTERVITEVPGETQCFEMDNFLFCGRGVEQREVEQLDVFKALEKQVNQRALERFRTISFAGLGGLFIVSIAVGWVIAGRALRPIGRITTVARTIGATDLSRRIRLEGPDDELKALADTFDEMLDRIDEAFENQRRFIHEASHELRNPIAVIRTNVEVALGDVEAPAEELRDTLAVVGRTADRMGVLVDDLLTYARRESPADRETLVDIAGLVGDSVAEFTAPAEARGLRLVAETAPGLSVHGDPVALKRALANLLANAVRLAPAGTVVQAACGRDGDWVWMAVQDQGPGIPPEEHARVFERFYRGDPGRARAEGRSGLGLTIVQQIARGHGGSVGLRSVPGVGSTFSVWLPAFDAPRGAGADRSAQQDSGRGEGDRDDRLGAAPPTVVASRP
ncbi:MAG: HAMP domain-containing sensor histidine kinase [Acidimicrobiales bacterium]